MGAPSMLIGVPGVAMSWLKISNWLFILASAFLFSSVFSYTQLSDDTLRNLPAAGHDFDIHKGAILAPILVPRVPGSPGSLAVQQHFLDFFATHLPKWKVEYQNSTSKTPVTGDREVPFANIIITRDPPWALPGNVGRLTLVAHYDSKYEPAGFIGATDSAAPCAMIMHAARTVDEALTRKWETMAAEGLDSGLEEEKGLQILFLDGEEAFHNWSDSDSLYGARSLAEEWEHKPHNAMSTYRTALSSISLFFLLDLLGSTRPTIPSYFPTTHWAYEHIATIESRMKSLSIMQSDPSHTFLPDTDKKPDQFYPSMMQDDHIPFLHRGVQVLHFIPSPFPVVWHRMEDDGEHLDMKVVEDWTRMITAFVAEWMDLEGFFPPLTKAQKKANRALSSKTEL